MDLLSRQNLSFIMITNNIKKKIEKDISKKIDLNLSFKKNNLDSLDLITAISVVEDHFKITVPEKSLKKIKDFKSLYKFIKNEKKL